MLILAATASAHEGLQGLAILHNPLSVAQLTAIVDAVVQRQMTRLFFVDALWVPSTCRSSHGYWPLLSCGNSTSTAKMSSH